MAISAFTTTQIVMAERMRHKLLHFADLMCGPVRSQPGGPVEEIVVSGGSGGSSKVEVYNVQEDSWQTGRRNKRYNKDLKIAGAFCFTTTVPIA